MIYQKPLARNLGDVSLSAHGYCESGSIATDLSGAQPCVSGGTASGGYCQNGNTARASQGSAPCRTGGSASGNCAGGSSAGLG